MPDNQADYENFLNQYLSAEAADATPAPRSTGSSPVAPLPAAPEAPVNNVVVPKNPRAVVGIPEFTSHYGSKKNYEVIELHHLPHHKFYFPGMKVEFRECDAREVEAFSMLDESSLSDFKNKIFELIQQCIRVTNADGTPGSAADLKEGDKQYLVLLIHEKTFVRGNTLQVKVPDVNERGEQVIHEIDVKRVNLDYYDPTAIMEYYDEDTRSFVFHTELQDEPLFLAPPTIGVKRCFDHYLRIKVDKGAVAEDINMGFFKYAPYLLPHVSRIEYAELEDLESWFETGMSANHFSFFDDLLTNHLNIGIRGLKKNLGSRTVRTNQVYPDRIRSLFVVPNAFSVFLRK